MNKELLYPSTETAHRLTRELRLESPDEYTQVWECEVANVNQLAEYISYYKNRQLNLNEKTTLMRIILEAYNDFIGIYDKEDEYGEVIRSLLENEYFIHHETIKYWSCEDDDLENCFAITSFIRTIRDSMVL